MSHLYNASSVHICIYKDGLMMSTLSGMEQSGASTCMSLAGDSLRVRHAIRSCKPIGWELSRLAFYPRQYAYTHYASCWMTRDCQCRATSSVPPAVSGLVFHLPGFPALPIHRQASLEFLCDQILSELRVFLHYHTSSHTITTPCLPVFAGLGSKTLFSSSLAD